MSFEIPICSLHVMKLVYPKPDLKIKDSFSISISWLNEIKFSYPELFQLITAIY